MGLGLSTPFEEDTKTSKVDKDEVKEIGICQLVNDPRSPSYDFERTPIYYEVENPTAREQEAKVVIKDPRSPFNDITRTPLNTIEINTASDEEIENKLRAQIERLKLYDTPSSANLANDKDIINPKKTILELLDEEERNQTEDIDSMCLPNTPPCPQSQSTPKRGVSSPETPVSKHSETGKLIKKKKVNGKKQSKRSQQSTKLQKTVLKKALNEQVPRSPLAERNVEVNNEKSYKKSSKTKSSGVIKYRKYTNLDESFSEVFPGKENNEIVW